MEKDKKNTLHNRRVIYAAYPHGMFSMSSIFCFLLHGGNKLSKSIGMNDVFVATNTFIIKIPIIGYIASLIGCIPANKQFINDMLEETKNKSILIAPEALQGTLLTDGKK